MTWEIEENNKCGDLTYPIDDVEESCAVDYRASDDDNELEDPSLTLDS